MIQSLIDEDASLAQLALSGPEYKVASNSQDKRHIYVGLADVFVCFYTSFEKPFRR